MWEGGTWSYPCPYSGPGSFLWTCLLPFICIYCPWGTVNNPISSPPCLKPSWYPFHFPIMWTYLLYLCCHPNILGSLPILGALPAFSLLTLNTSCTKPLPLPPTLTTICSLSSLESLYIYSLADILIFSPFSMM